MDNDRFILFFIPSLPLLRLAIYLISTLTDIPK